jgi:type I restriction enzyme, S subunit
MYGILQPGPDTPDGIPYVRPTEIVGDVIQVEQLRRTSPTIAAQYSRSSLKPDDLLLSIVGTIGKVAIVPTELEGANITQSSARIRLANLGIDHYFVVWALRSSGLRSQFDKFRLGTGVPRLNIAHVRSLKVPIAPLNEQRRVAAKLDDLFAKVDACRKRLEQVPRLLKQFRQSVLSAATSGRLLSTIAGGREKVSLDSVCKLDMGYAFKSAEFQNKGIRLLRGENIEPGRLRWTETKHFPLEKLAAFENLFINEGDVILAMDRPLVSAGLKIARAKKCDLPCVLVQRVCRFIPSHHLDASFLYHLLNEQKFIQHLVGEQTGTQVPHISSKQILSFRFKLPALAEQQEIIHRVEALFKIADAVEDRYRKAKEQLDKLPQSILAKAFRGELVPQDPDDEPASVLLERIRAEKMNSEKVTRKTKQPQRKAGQRPAASLPFSKAADG